MINATALNAIESLAKQATPGPWAWRGYSDGSIELRTPDRGQLTLLTSMRHTPCVVELADHTVALTADACKSCQERWNDPDEDFADYRCPKETNLNTLWLRDDDRHLLRPANDWAVREVPYRTDVVALTHPDARFIAEVNPAVVLDLVARIRELEERLAPAREGTG